MLREGSRNAVDVINGMSKVTTGPVMKILDDTKCQKNRRVKEEYPEKILKIR